MTQRLHTQLGLPVTIDPILRRALEDIFDRITRQVNTGAVIGAESVSTATTIGQELTVVDTTGTATIVCTLIPAFDWEDRVLYLRNEADAGFVKVTPQSGETIDGASSAAVPPMGALALLSDGASWHTLSRAIPANRENVLHYGANPDGSTVNQHLRFQAAIDAAEVSKKRVYIPPGDYLFSGGVTVTEEIIIEGDGPCTVITTNQATGDVIQFTAANTEIPGPLIQDLTIAASTKTLRTADYMINAVTANNTKIRNVTTIYAFHGLGFTGTVTLGCEVSGCFLRGGSLTGIGINFAGQTGTQGNIVSHITDVLIEAHDAGHNTGTGVNIPSCGDLQLTRLSTVSVDAAVEVSPATGQVVQSLTLTDCTLDSGAATGLRISPTGGKVQRVQGVNLWCATFGSDGVRISSSGSSVINTVSLINGSFGNNGQTSIGHGVNVSTADAENVTVTDCISGGNGNGGSGVHIAAGVSGFKLRGNTFGTSGQWLGNGAWGVLIDAGASDNYHVSDNIFLNGGTGELSDGGTGTNKVIHSNTGVADLTWTPTWSTSGTAPAIGNGTLEGKYTMLSNNFVTCVMTFKAGSTTTFGTGEFQFTLPITGSGTANGSFGFVGTAYIDDTGAGWSQAQVKALGVTPTQFDLSVAPPGTVNAARVTATVPMTWANGDSLTANFSYFI